MSKPKDGAAALGNDEMPIANGAPTDVPASEVRPPASAAPSTMVTLLGEIVWLLTQSPAHRHLFLADLEWAVIPAFKLRQVYFFRSKGRIVGLAVWAKVSEEVEKRLSNGINRLAPHEWNSGENLWLVDLVAPLGGAEHMIGEIKNRLFSGHMMKVIVADESGKRSIKSL